MILLRVRDVGKSFGGVRALYRVTFDISEGEVVGIMGANGAGKTTLFSLIAGHQKPDTGEIVFADRKLGGLSPDRICRLGIARTFQIVRPFRGLSVIENVATAALFGRTRALSPAAAEQRAAEIAAQVGLAGRENAIAGTLTLSDQKRLEVAKAVATGPRLLLLDEVMAGLTEAEVAAMLDTIRTLKATYGLTVLVIEHVMRALMRLSDRVIALHHGELIADAAPDLIAKHPQVLEAYLGETA